MTDTRALELACMQLHSQLLTRATRAIAPQIPNIKTENIEVPILVNKYVTHVLMDEYEPDDIHK